MPLTNEQIDSLLHMVNATEPDNMDCDNCFDHLAEFADIQLSSKEIPDAIKTVENHLQQCPCCKDEFEALLSALQGLEKD